MKKCRVCLEKFPTGDFVRYASGGRQKICKKCKRIESQKFADKRKEALKEWRSFYG